MPSSASIAVLGAGLAGLAAAQSLVRTGHAIEIYDKNPYIGGHASTHNFDGFLFDEGPHVSFTKKPEIQDLFAQGVKYQYLEHKAAVTNFWRGQTIPHPAQCHLHGLPTELVTNCLLDFVKAQSDTNEIANYADWCHKSLGRAFSEEFAFRYTRKYWTTEAANLSTDWVGSRVYPPKLEEVIRGALSPQPSSAHYITQFRYPIHGGFGSYAQAVLPEGGALHLGQELLLVDLVKRQLHFASGDRAEFDLLISSLPLPILIGLIKDVPRSVAEAAQKLVCTSVVLVNIGLARNTGFPDVHWGYVYDEDMLTSRIHFPHRLSPHMAPPGCGSIQAEVYFSPYRPLESRDILPRVLDDLRRLDLIHADDQILVARQQVVPFANVLFDHARAENLAIVQSYLAEQNVFCCGRYGEWAYYWSDDSVLSGRRAAARAATALVRPHQIVSNAAAA